MNDFVVGLIVGLAVAVVLSYPNYEVSDAMNASILTSVMDFF